MGGIDKFFVAGDFIQVLLSCLLRSTALSAPYQGMIFFSPFFFLLVDSFWDSEVLSAGFTFESVALVEPFVPPAVVALASVPASAGAFSAAGATAGAVPDVSPLASPVAAGAAPPVSPLSTVEPPDAP